MNVMQYRRGSGMATTVTDHGQPVAPDEFGAVP